MFIYILLAAVCLYLLYSGFKINKENSINREKLLHKREEKNKEENEYKNNLYNALYDIKNDINDLKTIKSDIKSLESQLNKFMLSSKTNNETLCAKIENLKDETNALKNLYIKVPLGNAKNNSYEFLEIKEHTWLEATTQSMSYVGGGLS